MRQIFFFYISSLIERFLNMLIMEVMHPDSHAPIGIKLHFIDIYLEELANIGAKEVSSKLHDI